MKIRLFLTILAILAFETSCFAVVIYCPECKKPIYDYQGEITTEPNFELKAECAKPINDFEQPTESSDFVCPFCKTPLNGWVYYGIRHKNAGHRLAYNAISVLVKEGEIFKWIPFDVPDCKVE